MLTSPGPKAGYNNGARSGISVTTGPGTRATGQTYTLPQTANNSGVKSNEDQKGRPSSSIAGSHSTTTSSKINSGPPYPNTNSSPARPSYQAPPMVSIGPFFNRTSIPKNIDPSLGGEAYVPPSCAGMGSYFNFYCKNTPAPSSIMKVIPWDHNRKDYVYTAVKDEDLRGKRRDLKRIVDYHKQADYWDPVSCYNLSLMIAIIILVITLIVIIIFLIVSYDNASKYWYVLVVAPILVILVGIIIHIALKNKANDLTFKRKRAIDQDLADFSRDNAFKVRSGEGSSYLEVFQGNATMPPQITDPTKSVITVTADHRAEHHLVEKQKINLMEGDDLNDVSTSKLMNGQEVKVEHKPVGQEEGMARDNLSLSATSPKKQTFKERLENKRKHTTTSPPLPLLPRATLVDSQHGLEYRSFKPLQQPTELKPMNLTLDDSALN